MSAGCSRARALIRGRDPAELAIFVLLGLLSVWTIAILVHRSIVSGEHWTGVDGLHVADQYQYLAWIRDAGRHFLISNPYRLDPTASSFLHPGFLVSGWLTLADVAPWLAYLLWQPVAVVALFLAVRAYVHRILPTSAARRAALILSLFYVSTGAFVASVVGAGATATLYLQGIEVDLWPGTWLWGYLFTVLAVAAIPAALLLYERDRTRGRTGPWGPLAGLLCSWFQPWQGATLLCILLATESSILVRERLSKRRGAPAPDEKPRIAGLLSVNLVAIAAPLAYYALLARLDPSWALAQKGNTFGAWPLWTLLASFGPLALPAAFAYSVRVSSFQDLAVRAWPIVGFILYWAIAYLHVGTFPIHTFQGLTIPFGILAVAGARVAVRDRGVVTVAAAACLLAAIILPALAWKLNTARSSIDQRPAVFPGVPPDVYFLTHAEVDALQFVTHDRRPGGVLTPLYLGQLIPAETGRRTWLGTQSWTPDYLGRYYQAESLFSGRMTSPQAVTLVRSTGARFLIEDCQHHADLARLLAPIVDKVRDFGCASVLHVGSRTAQMSGSGEAVSG